MERGRCQPPFAQKVRTGAARHQSRAARDRKKVRPDPAVKENAIGRSAACDRRFNRRWEALVAAAAAVAAREDARWQKRRRVFDSLLIMLFVFRLVVAPRGQGYCSGAQLKSCEDKGIEVYVPAPKQAARRGKGERFDSDDFRYDAQDDTYVCPAGQRLVRGGSTTNKRKLYFVYRSTAAGCRGCSLSHRCLAKGKSSRSVQRWEHEHVMDRHRKKTSAGGPLMRGRGALVEHPFGTLKPLGGDGSFSDARARQVPRGIQPDDVELQLEAGDE